ncbi:LysR family transcriptional regulator, partial [Agrobacterium sp. ATCC 31749]|uniref:LysR family transcriptional regulator n=2 Tax=unclassified Agrobacterium TaxID=2632611 RepID=UPI001AEBC5E5
RLQEADLGDGMIDLRTLETFVVVAGTGGFHKAAEKLHTTQPAVSARIAQLENELKVRLFERDNRGSRLTVKGREVLQYAERILALRIEMITAVSGFDVLEGTVQLGVSETLVHTILPELLRQLSCVYPGITLEISVDSSINLTNALIGGGLDVALLMGPVAATGFSNISLCTYQLSWIVHKDFPLTLRPLAIEDLSAFPIITFARQTHPFWHITALFEAAGLRHMRIFSNASLSSIIQMALDGIGVAAIPPQVVAKHIRDGNLRELTVREATLPEMYFTASYLKSNGAPLREAVATLAHDVAKDFTKKIFDAKNCS